MKQHEKDSQKQPDERTLMVDGQPKSETALNITNSNQADTTTPYVSTIGSTDDSIYVDVKPVIIDVCGGVDCPGTLAPKSTELSDTVLDEMALKDEYKCTCNDDKTATECLNVEASSLNVDEVATVDGIKEENLLSSTTSEASTTTSCNEKDSRYRSVEQIFFSSHLNQHYSAYLSAIYLFIDRCWICQNDYDSNKCLQQHVDSHCNSWVPYSKDAHCIL